MSERFWTIDSMEEDGAALETEGGRLVTVPSALLPEGAAEGMVVRVTTSSPESDQPLSIILDPAATAAALERSRAQLRRPTGEDPGGDIAL